MQLKAFPGVKLEEQLVNQVGNHFELKDKDYFGVEVELEGYNIITKAIDIYKYWSPHNDNSLRALKPNSQAVEYVLTKPLNLVKTRTAVRELYKFLNSPDVKVVPSYRTSIHVHVNCLMETVRTISNYITLCVIFDELFVSQNGSTRIGNNFCLRSRDAEGQIINAISSIKSYGNFNNLHSKYRYSSVNLASLNKYGTIEFRSLECTTNYKRVINWIELLQQLKENARNYADPREIIAEFSQLGVVQFTMRHLKSFAYKYILVPEFDVMIHNGMRLAQDFAYCSDWTPYKIGTRSTINPMNPPAPLTWDELLVNAQQPNIQPDYPEIDHNDFFEEDENLEEDEEYNE